MSFNFKKEYKEFYLPPKTPVVVEVPELSFIAVRGKGDPNEKNGAYQSALSVLYALAYTLKMSHRTTHKIDGFFEYVVPPLEGFWWQDDRPVLDLSRKDQFCWISAIRLPDFIKNADFEWAKAEVLKKKGLDCSSAEFLTCSEGLCVQIMHIGSFEEEAASILKMHAYLDAQGYQTDFTSQRLHHEIYLSDARKVPPEKWRTVIRHPIKPL